MEELDFFAQPRAIQDRFLGSTSGRADPAALAYMPLPDRVPVALSVGAVALFALAFGLAAVGYGNLDSRLALAPTWLAVVEALLLAAAGALLAVAQARSSARAALPFQTGLYLFPAALIVARGRRLQVHGLGELASATSAGSTLRLVFTGRQSFTVPAADAATASRAAEQVLAHRDAVIRIEQAGDERGLARLHPLKDAGIVSPLASTTALAAPAAAGRVPALVGAALLGAALGVGVWYERNVRSEAALFRAAQQANTIDAYQRYLARGGKRAEVGSVLLPRAELSRARQVGTVDAIEAFMRAHPGSPVLGEARAALRAVLDKQISDLAKAGRVGELRALEQHRHADLVGVELRQAIADVYQREIARYGQHAAGARADGRRCVEALLQYASAHGPVVELRTLEDPGGSLDTADLAVKHSPYFPGSTAVPSQYFDDDALARRAKAGAQALLASLGRAFGRDVLELRLAAPLTQDQADHLDALTVPTLVIERKTVLSGTFANASPPIVLVGVALTYVARCVVPASAPTLVLKDSSWNPPAADVLQSGDPPAKIYDATVAAHDATFNTRLLQALGLAGP